MEANRSESSHDKSTTEPQAASGKGLLTSSAETTLEHSVRDGCFHAVMLGAGEAYLAAFGVFLGSGTLVIGLLASLPLLLGSLAQLGAVGLLDRASRRKPFVTIPAFLQALTWIPVLLAPYLFPARGPALLLVFSLAYFALGSVIAPAWNSWMGDLVPPERRGEYFGRRDRLRTLWQFVAVLAAGGILSLGRRGGSEFSGFAVIFAIALVARLASTYYQTRMIEPPYQPPSREHAFTVLDFVKRIPTSNFGQFTLYVAAIHATTFLAGPFFTLYMLRDLQFNYLEFTAASTVFILAQAITFANWGRVGDRFGNLVVLKWTGIAIPFVPMLWLISPRFEFILVYQILSGFVWAGFNLSSANFLFDAVSPPKRARCVAYYNVLVNAGVLVGAFVGGGIAPMLPSEFSVLGFELPMVSNLQTLFLISGLGRLAVSLLFLPLLREVREVEKLRVWDVMIRIVGLSAIRGFRFAVFNGVHRSETGEEERKSSVSAPRDTEAPEQGIDGGMDIS